MIGQKASLCSLPSTQQSRNSIITYEPGCKNFFQRIEICHTRAHRYTLYKKDDKNNEEADLVMEMSVDPLANT